MCKTVPKGHTARDIVLVFDANQAEARLTVPYQFHNVREVWLREVFIVGANFDVGRLKFNNDAQEHEAINAVGEGFVFAARSPSGNNVSHTIYTDPRKISDRHKSVVTDVFASMTAVTSTTTQAAPQFTIAYFVFTIIMKDEPFTPAATFQQRQDDPRTAMGQYSTRAPWMKQ